MNWSWCDSFHSEHNMPQITTPHDILGSITWDIIQTNDDGVMVLFAQPLPVKMPFYNPKSHSTAHYIRTDYSQRNCTLYEVESNVTTSRYKDIAEYGCNQWQVSDLRNYLNFEFLNALPDDFRKMIVPQTHTLLLGQTTYSVGSNLLDKVPEQHCSDGTVVYDEFSGKGLRKTYSLVQDMIFVPSAQEINNTCVAYFANEQNRARSINDQPVNYWRMDAHIIGAMQEPYPVEIITTSQALDQTLRSSYDYCNARYPLHICPMCVIRKPE